MVHQSQRKPLLWMVAVEDRDFLRLEQVVDVGARVQV